MLMFLAAQLIFPQPAKKPQPAAPAAGAVADGKGQPAANAVAQAEDGKGAPKPADQNGEGKPQANGPLPQVAAVGEPAQFLTLGSLDPATGYRMLVTLSNTGASLRRAEMTSVRYLDQHDWSGYLGELELANADGGVKVQVVGPGTPAEAAKIVPGDVIVGIKASNEREVKNVDEFSAAMERTRPGQTIDVLVRGGNGATESRSV